MTGPEVLVDLPYIFEDRDERGNLRRFVRLPAVPPSLTRRKIRLFAEPGTEAFATEYWAARNATPIARPKITPAVAGSFRALVQAYYASPEFAALDRTYTQRERRRQLDPLVERIGALHGRIDPHTIRDSVKARAEARARKFLSALRHMYAFAVEAQLVVSDPTAGIRAKKSKTEGFHSWTLEECLRFEKRWPLGTKPRTAYAIALYLAARRSDVVRLGRQFDRGDKVAYRQHKNRKRAPVWVEHPIVPPLREALDAWRGKGLTWLETQYGAAYTAAGLGNAFAGWCEDAGLSHCSLHGLRKATAARLAELGASTKQIQAALGDKTLQQAEVYTRAADNSRMASDALGGLYGEQLDPKKRAVRGAGSKAAKKA